MENRPLSSMLTFSSQWPSECLCRYCAVAVECAVVLVRGFSTLIEVFDDDLIEVFDDDDGDAMRSFDAMTSSGIVPMRSIVDVLLLVSADAINRRHSVACLLAWVIGWHVSRWRRSRSE